MQFKYTNLARVFAILLFLQICMPHLADGKREQIEDGMALSGLAGKALANPWVIHQAHKYTPQAQPIPNGCFRLTLREPDSQDPSKYIETERLVCPNIATPVQQANQIPNGCIKQTVTEPDPQDPHKYIETERLVCLPVSTSTYMSAPPLYPPVAPAQPGQSQFVPFQQYGANFVQPQLPPSGQQSQSLYPILQAQYPHAPEQNPAPSVQNQFQQTAEQEHPPSLTQSQPDLPPTSDVAETTTKKPTFFQTFVDKLNTKKDQLKGAVSTLVTKYQEAKASKAEKHTEPATIPQQAVQNDTSPHQSEGSSKKKGLFGKSSSEGLWKTNIILVSLTFALILLQ